MFRVMILKDKKDLQDRKNLLTAILQCLITFKKLKTKIKYIAVMFKTCSVFHTYINAYNRKSK